VLISINIVFKGLDMNPYTWMRNNMKTGAGIVAPLYESASQDNHMALIRRKTVVNPSFRLENIVAAILPEDVLDEEITEQIDGKMVTKPLTKYLYYRKGVVPIIMPGRRAAISLEGMLEEAGVQGVFSIAIPMVINRIEDVHSELETAIKRLKITDATGITPTLYINVRVANSDSKEATERLLSDKLEIAMDKLGHMQIPIMVTYPVRAGQYDNLYHHPNTLKLIGVEVGKTVNEHTIRSNDGLSPCIPSIFHNELISYSDDAVFNEQLNLNIEKLKSLNVFTGT
tara:strand:+ start:2706 stop:3560 length:855 start_codon:yes stop_codon:yes gene_type:complete